MCSKCGRKKKINEFYTKGSKWDSKCKECAKKIRTDRYKKENSIKRKRCNKGRLMKINNVKYVEKFEAHGLKKQSLCKTVNGILEDHVLSVMTSSYLKGKDYAA